MRRERKKRLGKFGEDLARVFLEENGYQIIDTNFSTRFGEIDIIAVSPENQLVFCEVKTRMNLVSGFPEECIHALKLLSMKHVAMSFLHRRGISPEESFRFDAITLMLFRAESKAKLRHYKNIFST